MRILGVDYGDKRIGLALSDALGIVACPIGTYEAKGMRRDIDYIAELAKEKQAEAIVLGLPVNMDGSHGERAEKTKAFGRNLEKVSGLSVIYKDERLSTVSAEKSLIESNVRREKRKNVIDTVAAQIILQSYLDARR